MNCRQQRSYRCVEDSTRTGDDIAGVFDLGIAFHQRFEQIADLADTANDEPEDDSAIPCEIENRRKRHRCADAPGDD